MNFSEIITKIALSGKSGKLTYIPNSCQTCIHVILKSSGKYYGKIILKNDRPVFIKREDEKHIMRKYNGWGIHTEIFSFVDAVYIITHDDIYKIDSAVAFSLGRMDTVQGEEKLFIDKNQFLRKSNLYL